MWRLQAIIGGIGAFAIWMLYVVSKSAGVNSVKLEMANDAMLENKKQRKLAREISKNIDSMSDDELRDKLRR